MTTGTTKPEWDTPPHGDFAAYVERLTAPPPVRPAGKPSASAPASAPGEIAPLDLAQAVVPLLGVLRSVRMVLLLFIALHGIALFIFSQGSLPGLVVMAAVWWGLGWLIQSAPKIVAPRPGAAGFGTDALQERLRHVAQQRNTTRKKTPQ